MLVITDYYFISEPHEIEISTFSDKIKVEKYKLELENLSHRITLPLSNESIFQNFEYQTVMINSKIILILIKSVP